MALTLSGGWSVTYMFKDNNNKFATCSIDYAAALTQVEAEAAAAALATDLQNISNAELVSYTMLRQWVEDAPVAPPAESEVERKLRFSLGTALKPNVASIEVPSPVFTIEVANTDVVDPANPLVTALISELTSGLLLPGNGPVTHYGADITRADNPTIVHRTRAAKR